MSLRQLAHAHILLKLASSVRALLKLYGDTLSYSSLPLGRLWSVHVKESEHARLSKDTHGGEHTNFSQEDWRTRLDLTSWIPKALSFSRFSIHLAFVSLKLPSFWAVWRSSDKRGRSISQYPKGHVKEVKILTSRSTCEYILALRKQKT